MISVNMNKSTKHKQQGMAAITVTFIIMIIISLIVIGFATLSRREQRQTLDQQLSTQAFYAAESGINDTLKLINDNLANPAFNPADLSKTDCGNTAAPYSSLDPSIAQGVSYSCVLVNPAPESLSYDGVTHNPIVVPMTHSSGIDNVEITWRPEAGSVSNQASCPVEAAQQVFTPSGSWNCGHAVLRVDVTRAGGTISRTSLQDDLRTVYSVPSRVVYPVSQRATFNYSSGTNGSNTQYARCDANECRMHITAINNGGSSSNETIYLKISSIYGASNVQVVPKSGGSPLSVLGSQLLLDVTGKAQDVLRRVQVRVSINQNGIVPRAALESNLSVCKRFSTSSGYFNIPNDIQDADPNEIMCQDT